MSLAVLALLALSPRDAECKEARSKRAQLYAPVDAWLRTHARDCTLCDGGSVCREAFARREGPRKAWESWRAEHAAACGECAGVCLVSEARRLKLLKEAEGQHRARCDHGGADGSRCDGLRAALEAAKVRHAEWRREHAGICDRCAPDCPDWKRRSDELVLRTEETLRRHAERCADCKAGACERSDRIRQDALRERQAHWRAHLQACACARTPRK